MDETTPAQFLKGKRNIADTDPGGAGPIVPPMGMPMTPHARQPGPPPGEHATYGDGPHSGEHGFFTVQENPAAQPDVQAFGSPAGEPFAGYAPVEQMHTMTPAEPIGPTLPAVPAEPAQPAEPLLPAEPGVPAQPAESAMRPLTPDGQVAGDHCCACCGNSHAPGQDAPVEAQTLPAYDGQPAGEPHTLPAYDGQPPAEAQTLPAYDGQQGVPGQGVPAGDQVPAQEGQVTDPVPTDQPCACCGDVHPGSEPPSDVAPAPQQGAEQPDESDCDAEQAPDEPGADEQGSQPGASDDDECGTDGGEQDPQSDEPQQDGEAQTSPADDSCAGEQPPEQGESQPGGEAQTPPADQSSPDAPGQPGEGIEAQTLPADVSSPLQPQQDGGAQTLPADVSSPLQPQPESQPQTLPADVSSPLQPQQDGESQTSPADESCQGEHPPGQGEPAGQGSPLESQVGVGTGQQDPGQPTDPTQSFVNTPPDQRPGSTLPPTEGAVQPARPGEQQNAPGTGSQPANGAPPLRPAPSTPNGYGRPDGPGNQPAPGSPTYTPVGAAGQPGTPVAPVEQNPAGQGAPTTLPAQTGVPAQGTNPGSGFPGGSLGGFPGGQLDGNTSPDPNIKFDEGQYLKLMSTMDDIELSLKTEATFTDEVDLDAEFPLQPSGQTWEPAVTLNERGKTFGGSVKTENDKLRTAIQTFVDAMEDAKEVFKETDDLAAYNSSAFLGEYPGFGSAGGAL